MVMDPCCQKDKPTTTLSAKSAYIWSDSVFIGENVQHMLYKRLALRKNPSPRVGPCTKLILEYTIVYKKDPMHVFGKGHRSRSAPRRSM